MTFVLDDSLFDDPARLVDADAGGMLRSAAMAGAQVRSVGESMTDARIEELADERPRAIVLLARPGLGRAVQEVFRALLGQSCPVPVVVAETAPTWVGALDVVFGHTSDGNDPVLAESVARASSRGATVVLAAPEEGPVAAAAAGRATVLPPRLPVPAELQFTHVFAVGLHVLAAFGLLAPDMSELADELDNEAERAHPDHEPLTNPATSLALRLADRTPLLWGVDEVAEAAARHGAFALACQAGVPCDVASFEHASTRHALHRVAAEAGSGADIFADPEDTPGGLLRVFLVGSCHDEHSCSAEQAALSALPGADVVKPGESVRSDAVLRTGLLAARFDFASVYLGLASGTLGGPGRQALAMR